LNESSAPLVKLEAERASGRRPDDRGGRTTARGVDDYFRARQGSITSIPQPAKSATLRVASSAPFALAMAAICASKAEMGRPDLRRSAAIRA
jgi:hypothetical protein